jgi:hypothetical protein
MTKYPEEILDLLTEGLDYWKTEEAEQPEEVQPPTLKVVETAKEVPISMWFDARGVYHAHIPEDGKWHYHLDCPKCHTAALAVVKNKNGTGGCRCHSCGFGHGKNEICSYANYAEATGQKYADENKLVDISEILVSNSVAVLYSELQMLVPSLTSAIILNRLLYIANGRDWVEIGISDKTLMRIFRVKRSVIERLKRELEPHKTWCRLRQGKGFVTHYLFKPIVLKKAVDERQATDEAQQQRQKRGSTP